jgi:uncharacterized protein (UPF0305 family)
MMEQKGEILDFSQRMLDQKGEVDAFILTMKMYVDKKEEDTQKGIDKLVKDLEVVKNHVEDKDVEMQKGFERLEEELDKMKGRMDEMQVEVGRKKEIIQVGVGRKQEEILSAGVPPVRDHAPGSDGAVVGLSNVRGINFKSGPKPKRQCKECHAWYARAYLAAHMKIIHGNAPVSGADRVVVGSSDVPGISSKPKKECRFCRRWYSKAYIEAHMKNFCKIGRLQQPN